MLKPTAAALAAALTAVPAAHAADRWVLSGDESLVAYGSIKSDYIGEVNHLPGLSGQVTPEGEVTVSIDLMRVETMVDIRNERMREIIFAPAPEATLTAQIDMTAFDALAPGETMVMEVDGTLGFLGEEVGIYADMFVARLGEDRTLVTTSDMVMVATDELGIDAGIDRLKELAGLDSITRVAPVTLRLVFDRSGEGA